METHSFRLSLGLCTFSPNGLHVAVSNQQRLSVYLVSKFNPFRVFQCTSFIEFLEWSADSELILSACPASGKMEVWSINQPDWKCKISTGLLGLISAQFAPGSRHVLTTATLNLRLTIWSLNDRTVWHINLPKEAHPGVDFSVGGSYMAVVERRLAKDCVAVYACDTWTQITVIDSDTVDLGGVKWSPDGSKLALWDGSHSGKLIIFSISGSKLAELTDVFGIHDIEWSPSAQIIAVAIAGSKVKLINHLSWHPISTLCHPTKIESSSCVIYREAESKLEYQVVSVRPVILPSVSLPSGQLALTFSADARYLAIIDQLRPNCVWIWDIPWLSLKAVLVQQAGVKSFKWSRFESRLAVVCGTSCVYTWTTQGCAVIDLKTDQTSLKAERVEWNASSKFLMVAGKETGCICKVE